MPKVSQAHLESRRVQILEAAIECFVREGFHGATMQDIVRESGLSPGAIYSYFESKDDIIEAIANERHARERALISEARLHEAVNATLSQLVQTFFGSLQDPEERKRRRLGIQVWAEALTNPQLLKIVLEGVEEPRTAFVKIIMQAQQNGKLPRKLSADALARVMIAVFQGFVLQQAWEDEIDIEAYVETIEAILAGLMLQA